MCLFHVFPCRDAARVKGVKKLLAFKLFNSGVQKTEKKIGERLFLPSNSMLDTIYFCAANTLKPYYNMFNI